MSKIQILVDHLNMVFFNIFLHWFSHCKIGDSHSNRIQVFWDVKYQVLSVPRRLLNPEGWQFHELLKYSKLLTWGQSVTFYNTWIQFSLCKQCLQWWYFLSLCLVFLSCSLQCFQKAGPLVPFLSKHKSHFGIPHTEVCT